MEYLSRQDLGFEELKKFLNKEKTDDRHFVYQMPENIAAIDYGA